MQAARALAPAIAPPSLDLPRDLGRRAAWSLAEEALLSPKPGLVDRRGRGAHADLDLGLMLRSAAVLEPSFVAMADAAQARGRADAPLRETLGRLGRAAEHTMMNATGGVNTHRGAIWALGLLTGAAALEHDNTSAADTARWAGTIARHADRFAPAHFGKRPSRDIE